MSGISEYEVQFWNRLSTVAYTHNRTIAGLSLYVELNKEFPILKCLPQDFNQMLHSVYTDKLGGYSIGDIVNEISILKNTVSTQSFIIDKPTANWMSVAWTVIEDDLYCTVFATKCSMINNLPHDITRLAIMLNIIARYLSLNPCKLLYASATAYIENIDLYNKANYNLFCVKQAADHDPCDTLPSKVFYSSPRFEIAGGLSIREKFDSKVIKLIDYIHM